MILLRQASPSQIIPKPPVSTKASSLPPIITYNSVMKFRPHKYSLSLPGTNTLPPSYKTLTSLNNPARNCCRGALKQKRKVFGSLLPSVWLLCIRFSPFLFTIKVKKSSTSKTLSRGALRPCQGGSDRSPMSLVTCSLPPGVSRYLFVLFLHGAAANAIKPAKDYCRGALRPCEERVEPVRNVLLSVHSLQDISNDTLNFISKG